MKTVESARIVVRMRALWRRHPRALGWRLLDFLGRKCSSWSRGASISTAARKGNVVSIASGGRVNEEFATVIGQEIRSLRQQQGLTVTQLADASELSRKVITQIEFGRANPSLRTVDKIANSLGTDLPGLIRRADHRSIQHVPASEATRVWRDDSGSEAYIHVTSSLYKGPALWTWTQAPHTGYEAQPDPPRSEEFFYVLEGELKIESDIGTVIVGQGEAARIPTDQAYSWVNETDFICRFVRVVHAQ